MKTLRRESDSAAERILLHPSLSWTPLLAEHHLEAKKPNLSSSYQHNFYPLQPGPSLSLHAGEIGCLLYNRGFLFLQSSAVCFLRRLPLQQDSWPQPAGGTDFISLGTVPDPNSSKTPGQQQARQHPTQCPTRRACAFPDRPY